MTGPQFMTAILAVVALLTALLFWAYRAQMEKDITVAIIAGSATILASVIVVSVTQYTTTTAKVAEAHRLKKTEVYSEFGDLVFLIFQTIKTPNRPDLGDEAKVRLLAEEQARLQAQYSSFSKKLLLWGSPDVIHSWLAFTANSRVAEKETDPKKATAAGLKNLLFMDDVFRAMRKDLDLSNSDLNEGDLVKAFLTDPELLDPVLGSRRGIH